MGVNHILSLNVKWADYLIPAVGEKKKKKKWTNQPWTSKTTPWEIRNQFWKPKWKTDKAKIVLTCLFCS